MFQLELHCYLLSCLISWFTNAATRWVAPIVPEAPHGEIKSGFNVVVVVVKASSVVVPGVTGKLVVPVVSRQKLKLLFSSPILGDCHCP